MAIRRTLTLGLAALALAGVGQARAEILLVSTAGQTVQRLDTTTGNTADFIPAGSGLQNSYGMAYDPAQAYLHVVDLGDGEVRRFDPVTGAAVPPEPFVGSGGLPIAHDIAFVQAPGQNLFWVSSFAGGVVRQYDSTTGAATGVVINAGGNLAGLDVGADGNLYVSSFSGGTITRYDAVTGAPIDATAPFIFGLTNPNDLTFLSNGDILISTAGSSDAVLRYGASGSLIGTFASGLSDPYGILQVGSDVYVADSNANQVRRYDLAGNLLDSFAVTNPIALVRAVPEPASLLMVGLGGLGLAAARLARRRA